MRRHLPALLALALLAPACATTGTEEGIDLLAAVREFIGGRGPADHVERLGVLHDTATFRHVPDLPPTEETCLDEVRSLARADYGTWREVAVATFYVTRVASEDSSSLNRGEAVGALARLGGMVLEQEEVPAAPSGGDAAARALKRLRELHDPVSNLHPSAEAAAECAAEVAVLGSYRAAAPPDALRAELQYELRVVRGTLMGLMVETRSFDAHRDAGHAAAIDRAAVNLASQAVRLSLASALRFDPQPTVRTAAAAAAARLGVPGMAEVLQHAYAREESAAVRHGLVTAASVAAAAGRADRGDGVTLLIAALSDDDEKVRFVARDALRSTAGEDLGPRAEAWIRWWASAGAGGGR